MSQAPQSHTLADQQEVLTWLNELLRLLQIDRPGEAGASLEDQVGTNAADTLHEMVGELRDQLSELSGIHATLDQILVQSFDEDRDSDPRHLVLRSKYDALVEERKQLKRDAEAKMQQVNDAIGDSVRAADGGKSLNLGELVGAITALTERVKSCIRERTALLRAVGGEVQRNDSADLPAPVDLDEVADIDELSRRLQAGGPHGKAASQVLEQHKAAYKKEQQAFFNAEGQHYESFDDILKISDPKTQLQALRDIQAALIDSANRRQTFDEELTALDGASQGTDTKNRASAAGRLGLFWMDKHIPETFLAEREKILQRIEIQLMTAAEKEAEVAKLEQEQARVDQDAVRKAFEQAIERRSVKTIDRIDPYFDPLLTPPTKEEMDALMPHIDAAVRRARRTLECLHKAKWLHGDELTTVEKLKRVEAMMEPIPRTWWPAEFVLELQAWRKVEREEIREAMLNTAEEQRQQAADAASRGKEISAAGYEILKQVTSFSGQPIGMASDVTFVNIDHIGDPDANIWSTDFRGTANELTATDQAHNDLNTLTMLAEKGYDWVVSDEGPYARLPAAKRKERVEGAVDVASKLASTIRNTVNYTEDAREGMGAGVPVLGLFASSMGLALAIHHLCQEKGIANETQAILESLMKDRMSNLPNQDPALEAALRNQAQHSSRRIAEEGVNVTKSGLKVAAGVAEASGVGMPIAWGIKLTGHVIEVGGRITFANIDCSRIQQAKKTLAEARAGNRIAQQQIFEDSAHYAKMYLAILVQEDDRRAIHFLHVMGLEEADLSREDVCAHVLRDALLARAKQKDDTKESASRGRANLDAISGVNSRKVQKAISALKPSKSQPTDPYKKDYQVTQPVVLASAIWEAAIKDARANAGLVKGTEQQVSQAMLDLVKASQGLPLQGMIDRDSFSAALEAIKPPNTSEFRTAENVKSLVAAFANLNQSLMDYAPLHTGVVDGGQGSPGIHEPVEAYQLAVKRLAGELANQLDRLASAEDFLGDGDRKNPSWQVTGDVKLTAAEWKQNWEAGCQAAWIDGADDLGVGKALSKAEKALSHYIAKIPGRHPKTGFEDRSILKAEQQVTDVKTLQTSTSKIGKEVRPKKLELEGSLKHLITCLQQVRTTTTLNGMQNYVDRLRTIAASWLRDLDKQLYADEKDWPFANVKWEHLDQATWEKVYPPAVRMGLVDDVDDPKIGDKLKTWKSAHDKIDAAQKESGQLPSQETGDARIAAYAKLKAVFTAAETYLTQIQTPGMQQFVLDLIKKIQAQSIEYDRAQSSISFGIAEDFTSNGTFTSRAFNTTCKAAISVGAVPEEKSKQKAVADAIKAVVTALAAVGKAKGAANRRSAMHNVLNKLDTLPMHVNALLTVHEYAVNETMSEYLRTFLDHPKAREMRTRCTQVLRAEDTRFEAPSKFEFSNDQWQTFKRDAVIRGILDQGIVGMKATGVKSAMAAVTKAHDALEKFVRGKGTDDKEKQRLLDDAYDATRDMRELINELKDATDNNEFRSYMDMFLADLQNRELQFATVA